MHLIPGQHLIIQTIKKDDVLERSYTPIPGDHSDVSNPCNAHSNTPFHLPRHMCRFSLCAQSFDLVIKLYPKGQMSRYLKGLAVGDVVKFRGPGESL